MKRPRLLLALAAACAVVALAASGVSVWALTADASQAGSVDASSSAAAPADRLAKRAGSPVRTGAFSFGHTIVNEVPSPGGPIDAGMRLPFELGVPATQFRVHLRNWQFNSEEVFDSPVTITGMAVGEQSESPVGTTGGAADGTVTSLSGEFAGTPIGIAGAANLSAEGFVTNWIDPSRFELHAGTSYLLAVGFTAPAGARLASSQALSWLDTDGASGLIATPGVLGAAGPHSYFDVWIEYGFEGDAPLLVSVGHSLNAPGSIRTDLFPTRGEETAWPQQWALSNDAVAVSFASPGAETTVFAPGNSKWQQFGELQPDIVTVWTASNDIAHGRPLADIQRDWTAVLAGVRARWPEAQVLAMTEPPRHLTGEAEATRLAWNAWLALVPAGVDRVLDADFALRDPAQPSELRPDVDADGTHFSARGHSLIADLVPAPRR